MNKEKIKNQKRTRRHIKIRAKISGTGNRPRLSVFKSNRNIFAQLIDDMSGRTIISVHTREISQKKEGPTSKTKKSGGEAPSAGPKEEFELGKLLAQKASEKKIKTVVFDRGGYKYHGRIKAFADGARAGGLEF